jgi:predicted Rossmann-fold nucleotide-binding protein
MGSDYWSGLIDWIKKSLLEAEGNINPQDLNLFQVADTADEAVKIITDFYSKYTLKPNF